MVIDSFFNQYYFLSNFYPSVVQYEGVEFLTVEHAYQAAKTYDKEQREAIRQCLKPGDAKRLGRKVTLRRDWNKVKQIVMFNLVYQKFQRYPHLRVRLLETGDQQLVEGNTWHDNYWGNCTCLKCANIEGSNNLGIILMNIRHSLLIVY